MRTLFTFLLTLCVSGVMAQPTLNKHMKYNIGDWEQIGFCDTSGMSAGMKTGANMTWNITLSVLSSGSIDYVDISTNSYGSQFPGANIARKWPSGTYQFFQKTATGTNYVGRAVGSGPTAILSPSPLPNTIWPYTFKSSFRDTVPVSYPKSAQVPKGTIRYTDTADAYGTLVVNGKTYTNVLRTKTNSDAFDLSNKAVESLEWIRFWDAAHKTALLTIRRYENKWGPNPSPPSYEIYLLEEELPVSIKDTRNLAANINAFSQNGQLYLKGELESGKEYQMNLYNYSGQNIISQTFTAQGQVFNTSVPDMPTGVYFIQLQKRGEAPGYVKFFHQ